MQLLLLHGAIGFMVYLLGFTSTIYFLISFIIFMIYIISKGNKNNEVLLAAAYFTGAEVFFRMTETSIPYEAGKYIVIFFLFIGMIYRGTSLKSVPYWIFIFLLIPGIVFSAMNLNYETNVRNAIVFNLSGPFCLGIAAIYSYHRQITRERLQHILLALLLPIVTTAVYLFFFTPDIKDALHGTQSNFETSGGFGPNQVATILGLGMLVLFTRLFTVKSKLINIIDLGLLIFISYRAIITFSRGGVITAGICALVFFAIYFFSSNTTVKARLIPKISIIIIGIIFTWIFTSVQTTGLIDNRYSNRDAAGRLKEDITTGRSELITSELIAFYESPYTGIGVGKIKEYRYEKTGITAATHNEVSRLLSEHGIAGLIALIILFFTPLFYWLQHRRNPFILAFFAFWFITINHSSMRLAAPAFVYGLCLLYLINETKSNSKRKINKS